MSETPIAGSSPSELPKLPWSVATIERYLPHRAPFLFVDSIDSFESDSRITGSRTWNPAEAKISDPEGRRGVPAAYLTECMAQVGALLVLAKPENRGKLIYFSRIDKVRFRAPVWAGETVAVEARVLRLRSRNGSLAGIARVGGRVVVEGTMMFALSDAAS